MARGNGKTAPWQDRAIPLQGVHPDIGLGGTERKRRRRGPRFGPGPYQANPGSAAPDGKVPTSRFKTTHTSSFLTRPDKRPSLFHKQEPGGGKENPPPAYRSTYSQRPSRAFGPGGYRAGDGTLRLDFFRGREGHPAVDGIIGAGSVHRSGLAQAANRQAFPIDTVLFHQVVTHRLGPSLRQVIIVYCGP